MISIHAPSRERPNKIDGQNNAIDFNPRSLAGATNLVSKHLHIFSISIHAPSRERRTRFCPSAQVRHFNPRSLAGATLMCHNYTVPHKDFNPRSLAGATFSSTAHPQILSISIHAPSRERLHLPVAVYSGQDISIHAPSRERRSSELCQLFFLEISIHAPSRERLINDCDKGYATKFQSTLPRGSDSIKTNYFSIHLNQAFFAN